MNETIQNEAWTTAFTDDQREEQLESDRDAWRGIIGILLAIVAVGSSMAAVVVWAITKFT